MPENTTPAIPDPQTGGRYKRREDGSLQEVQVTKPAEGRVKGRAHAGEGDTPAPAPAQQTTPTGTEE